MLESWAWLCGTELLSGGSGVAGALERVSSLPLLSHTQHCRAVPVVPDFAFSPCSDPVGQLTSWSTTTKRWG